MRSTPRMVARLGMVAGCMTLATLALVAPVSGATSGTVGVTGGSASKLELTIPDDTAALGSNLTPDGVASNSSDTVGVNVDPAATSTGACYEWGGTIEVRSNRVYYVTVSAADNSRLDFMTSNPADFSDCTGGEPVDTSMFPSGTPASSWATNQTTTAKRTHSYWLGLAVLWTDAPDSALGAATLTFTATAAS